MSRAHTPVGAHPGQGVRTPTRPERADSILRAHASLVRAPYFIPPSVRKLARFGGQTAQDVTARG
jgi:hypothetical protein